MHEARTRLLRLLGRFRCRCSIFNRREHAGSKVVRHVAVQRPHTRVICLKADLSLRAIPRVHDDHIPHCTNKINSANAPHLAAQANHRLGHGS